MSSSEVVVVGSCNMDLVTYTPRFPKPGETLHGSRFDTGFGGKGANQCAAAAKLGARTTMLAKVGNDDYGRGFIENFKSLGVVIDNLSSTNESSTGVALITVDNTGNNCIVIVSGANLLLSATDIDHACETIKPAKVLLCQLEIDQQTTLHALKLAKSMNVLTIFNPAPAPTQPLPTDFYKFSDVICPNESEASLLTGIEVTDVESAKKAASQLIDKGCGIVIITLGSDGCVFIEKKGENAMWVKAEKVKAVDTTGAGDAFAGALAFYFAKHGHLPLEEKIRRACFVASRSVCGEGTQKSFPYRDQLPSDMFA